jgi:chromosome segregation ATPase
LKSEYLVRANAGESSRSVSQADGRHLSNLHAERDQLQREVEELNITLDQAIKERDRLLEEDSRNCGLAHQTRRKKKENLQKDKGSKPGSVHKSNNMQSKEKASIKQINEARAALKSLKRQIEDTVDMI